MDRFLLSSFASAVVLTTAVMAICPERAAVQNLNLEKFSGRWYGIMKPMTFGSNYKCAYEEFTPRGEGVVSWLVKQYNTTLDGWEYLHGEASQIENSGQFVGFRAGVPGGVKFQVLGTDYHRWAVTWTCHESNDVEWGYLLSREPEMSSKLQQEVSKLLPDMEYTPLDQDNCPSYSHPKCLNSNYLRR